VKGARAANDRGIGEEVRRNGRKRESRGNSEAMSVTPSSSLRSDTQRARKTDAP
jgi:hypothetical protein